MKYFTKSLLITFLVSSALMSGSLLLATTQFQDAGVKGNRYIRSIEFFEKSGFDFIFNNPSQSQLDAEFTLENGIEDFFAVYRERATFIIQSQSFRGDALFAPTNLETVSSPFIESRLINGNRIESNKVYIDETLASRGNISLGSVLSIRLDLDVTFSLSVGGIFPKDPYYQDGIAFFLFEGNLTNLINDVYTTPFQNTKLRYGKAFAKSNNIQLINTYINDYAPEGRMLGPENFFTNLEYIDYVNNFRSQSYPLDTISASSEIQYYTNLYKPSFDEALSIGSNQFILISIITILISVVITKVISRQLLLSGGKDLMLKQNFLVQTFTIFVGETVVFSTYFATNFFLLDQYLVKNDIINQININLVTLVIISIVFIIGLILIELSFSKKTKLSVINAILNQKVPADFKFRDPEDKTSKK
jgi:hypothetical protein